MNTVRTKKQWLIVQAMQCVVTLNERKSTSALLVWQNRHAVASILHANASAFGASHSVWALSGNPTPKWALNLRVRLSTLSRVHTQRCITGGSCHKYHFGRDKSFVDKSMLVVTKVLSRKNYVCRDKTFVTTYICRDKQFWKHTSVATKDVFCRDKRVCDKNDTCSSPRQWQRCR